MMNFAASQTFDASLVRDEKIWCSADSRVEFQPFASRDALLPVVIVQDIDSFSHDARQLLNLLGNPGSYLMLGGGFANHTSVAWSSHASLDRHRASLVPHVRSALRHADNEGQSAVAISVRSRDLPAFLDTDGVSCAVDPSASHYGLDLRGARSVEEYFEGVPGKQRRTWQKDIEDARRLGLFSHVQVLTPELCASSGELVADTSARNGFPETSALAEWRLLRYLDRPGSHYVAQISNGDGRRLGFAAWSTVDDVLVAHTVATGRGEVPRVAVYHYAFQCVLEFALVNAIGEVRFGPNHSVPKTARGCVREPRWRVLYNRQQ